MNIEVIKTGIAHIALFVLLTGCASTPANDENRGSTTDLNDESYDLLFATEFPVESEADALARGGEALKEGEVDKALFFYVRALQFNPENSDLLAHIGGIQMQRNNVEMARRAFLLAKKHNPEHTAALEGLGLIYMADGSNERAVLELETALKNDNSLWRAHNALGVNADKTDNFSDALGHYNAALMINPNAAHVLNNRGYSKFLAGDVEGATADLYTAANDRGFPQAWANLGMVYAKQGWYDDAITTYQKVMSEAHAYNNTGEIALENGELTEARRLLNEAIRLSPTYFPEAEQNLKLLAKLN
jgi:Flp pilus assembly protein TadD